MRPQLRRHAARPRPSTHRADIDILRAIAVLAVLGFHFGLPGLPGGFAGVDLFFVISGFLIARTTLEDLDAGRFSLAAFYERRIRRILPALHLVTATTLVAGWFLLLPSDYERLGQSVASLGVFASNVLFNAQTGYFEPEAATRPLLHTWSLAVEEQFYLVAPCLIGWLAHRGGSGRRWRWGTAVLGTIAVLSLAASQWMLSISPGAAFYLAPFRAWEFLAGVVLAWLRLAPPGAAIGAILRTLGLALIGGALFGFRADTPFPGVDALVPCLGAVLFLAAGPARNVAPALAPLTRIGTFFGRISYSLYLWHWPIVVFFIQSHGPLGPPAPWQIASLFALTTLLAWLTCRFVELPFRQRRVLPATRAFLPVIAGASVLLLVAGAAITVLHGVPSRIDARLARITRFDSTVVGPDYRDGSCFLEPDQPFARFDKARCTTPVAGTANLLLWGDSTAAHYAAGLQPLMQPMGVNLMQATSASCAPFFDSRQGAASHNCQELLDWTTADLLAHPPSVVLMSANWRSYEAGLGPDSFSRYLRATLEALSRAGIPVILFGPSIEYDEALPSTLVKNGLNADFIRHGAPLGDKLRLVDDLMREVAGGFANTTYISIARSVCPDDRCPVLTPGGDPLQWDRIHLTPGGSQVVIAALATQMRAAIVRAQHSTPPPA